MARDTRILVGDIGGTNTRLAIARVSGARIAIDGLQIHGTAGYSSLADALAEYLSQAGHGAESACLALAGPIENGTGVVTNVGWTVDAMALERRFGLPVRLLNDFAALAYGVPCLDASDILTVKPGAPGRSGPLSVMGAGTGFGCALLVPGPKAYTLVASESGHADFAPTSEHEWCLWQWLKERHAHVSVETLLSGTGLAAIHEALNEFDGVRRKRTPEEICRRALEDDTSTSAKALKLFCNIFGSVAGNIALTQGATGGVYLAGGVLMKNTRSLLKSDFAVRFSAKGPMTGYLEKIPVFLVQSEFTALMGAARWFMDQDAAPKV